MTALTKALVLHFLTGLREEEKNLPKKTNGRSWV